MAQGGGRRLGLTLAVLALSLSTGSCGEGFTSAADELNPWATALREGLARPIDRISGVGSLHQEVSTSSAAAQSFHDQGLAYLASFEWLSAARSFRTALNHDPDLAMARTGLARAFLGLEAPGRALAEARLAQRSPVQVTHREALWVELAVAQMEGTLAQGGEAQDLQLAYVQAIDHYLDRYPDDSHGLVLRGNGSAHAANPGSSGGTASLHWYRRALEVDPDHFPAHHFLAHTLENLGQLSEALHHARRYQELAPQAPHAQHMVAHVLASRDEWAAARRQLEKADRLHRENFEKGRTTPDLDWHYGHNLRLLGAVLLYQGAAGPANDALHSTFGLTYAGRRAGFYCAPWIEHLLAEGRFEEALASARSCEKRDSLLARVMGAGFRGEALLGMGRIAEAEEALATTTKRQAEFLASLRYPSVDGPYLAKARLATMTLDAKLRLRTDDPEGAEALLRQVLGILGRGQAVDSWALAPRRIRELARDARKAGYPELARDLLEALG